jgi:hypothetical protein
MAPHHTTPADGHHLALHDVDATLLSLLTARQIDTHQVVEVGRSLFEAGGMEALETILDRVTDWLGRGIAYELALLWTPIVAGEDTAA